MSPSRATARARDESRGGRSVELALQATRPRVSRRCYVIAPAIVRAAFRETDGPLIVRLDHRGAKRSGEQISRSRFASKRPVPRQPSQRPDILRSIRPSRNARDDPGPVTTIL